MTISSDAVEAVRGAEGASFALISVHRMIDAGAVLRDTCRSDEQSLTDVFA